MRHLSLYPELPQTPNSPSIHSAWRPVVALVGAELEENLALRYLASSLEVAGFAAILLPCLGCDDHAEVADQVLATGAIVVGISVPFQVRARETLGLAHVLRGRGYDGHIVAGGHFATFEYERILQSFPLDSVVRHEGETTLRDLCERVRDGLPPIALPGLVIRDGAQVVVGAKRPLSRLDDLPVPDRRGAPHRVLGVPSAPFVSSRGCYADCSFCCIYAYADNADGARYRMRSPELVVAEMAHEYRHRGVRLFAFEDDNFFLPHLPTNLKRQRRFTELLRAEGLTDIGLVLKCRPNDVDRDLFSMLKDAGLTRVYLGIETNSDEGIVSLNRNITADDNQRAIAILRELDIYFSSNILLFDPEAKLEGIERNLDFMSQHLDVPINFCRAEVYAGTPLQSILREQGRLLGDWLAWGYEMRDPRVELMFRIAATAWATRNFRHDGISNLNNGIRLDGELYRRFYPSLWTAAWHERVRDFSRRVGNDNVEKLRVVLELVRSERFTDRTSTKRFAIDLAREIARVDLQLLEAVRGLRAEMEEGIRGVVALGSRLPGLPPWSAETLRLGTSVGREISTEVLPAPSDVQ